ncbi:MAG: serine hydrolase [Parcubacteria group bacterium]|jgi:beta-lactamase class A
MKNKKENENNFSYSFGNKYFWFFIFLVLLMFFFYLGFLFGKKSELKNSKNYEKNVEQNKEIRQSGYKFIDPLLECEVKNTSPIFKSSELKIKKTIQEDIIAKNSGTTISVYYRDLKNGPAFGINEQEKYSPASLFKVPLMITYYKYAEKNYDIFNKEISFDKPSLEFYKQEVKPANSLEVGKKYTVASLIEAMIVYSDNEAANLLFQNINTDDLNIVFSDLGLSAPNLYDPNNLITTKDYASFFRILYNSSYLNRSMSEQALTLLSAVDYRNGLIAGVPSGTMVSHKFGEREYLDENKKIVRQLHDCGIIYHSERPYLLCVMTKGEKFEDLSKIISRVSNIIYEEVNNR